MSHVAYNQMVVSEILTLHKYRPQELVWECLDEANNIVYSKIMFSSSILHHLYYDKYIL